MKANEIKVGDHYIAKVGVNITVVKVDSINKRDGYRPAGYGQRGFAGRTTYSVTNVKTGRTTTFESASKFRRAATIEEIRKAKGIAAPANPAFKVDQPRGIDTYRAAQEKAKLGSAVPAPLAKLREVVAAGVEKNGAVVEIPTNGIDLDRAWTDDGRWHEPRAHHPAGCGGCNSDPTTWGRPHGKSPVAVKAEGEPVFVVILLSLTHGTEYVGRDGDGRFGLYLLGCSAHRFRGHSGWKSAMSFANQYARPDRSAFVVCESYTTGPC